VISKTCTHPVQSSFTGNGTQLRTHEERIKTFASQYVGLRNFSKSIQQLLISSSHELEADAMSL